MYAQSTAIGNRPMVTRKQINIQILGGIIRVANKESPYILTPAKGIKISDRFYCNVPHKPASFDHIHDITEIKPKSAV